MFACVVWVFGQNRRGQILDNFLAIWTNLDNHFLGLSSDFGREFEKYYIIVETRFWNGVGKFVNFAQGAFLMDRYVLFFRYTYGTIVVRIELRKDECDVTRPII